jgi:hypothetical protein
MTSFLTPIAKAAKANSDHPDIGHRALLDLASAFLGYATYEEFRADLPDIHEGLERGGQIILDLPMAHRRSRALFKDPATCDLAYTSTAAQVSRALPKASANDTAFLREYIDEELLPAIADDDSPQLALAQVDAGGGCTQLVEPADILGDDFEDTAHQDSWTARIDLMLKRPGTTYDDPFVGVSSTVTFQKHGRCVVVAKEADLQTLYHCLPPGP